MNNNKADHHKISSRAFAQQGQALVLVMAILLIGSVVLFLVFNSGRAVNEKINLVNAADAASYSGAQIAARQLNFMAYTNRAMIANELAVGHLFSFQMELDVTVQSLGTAMNSFAAMLGLAPLVAPWVSSITSGVIEGGRTLTAAYASLVDANNALYSTLQYEVYKDLAYPVNGRTLIEAAMGSVVSEYELRPTAPISINDNGTLAQFVNSTNPDVAGAALSARNMGAGFCQMVLFVKPSNEVGGDLGSNNDVAGFCSQLASNGAEGGQAGSAANPLQDDGGMRDMLRTMVSEAGNTEWIRDRESIYRLLGFNIHRRGTTTLNVEGSDDRLNWRSNSDRFRVGDPVFNIQMYSFSAADDVNTMSEDMSQYFQNPAVVQKLADLGLCQPAATSDGAAPSCEDALMNRYQGIRRYTHFNPSLGNPVITAFLSQTSCGDNVGVNENGIRNQGWRNGPRFLDESKPFCSSTDHPTVYAVSQAEVVFERPPCDDASCTYGFRALAGEGQPAVTELPNLYNPFWQARLRPQ